MWLLAGEHSDGDFWTELWSITFDPAHIVAELMFTIVFDGIIIALMYNLLFKKVIMPRIKKNLANQIHKEIDEEHGYDH